MKTSKKIFSLILCVVLALSNLSGCSLFGKSESTSSNGKYMLIMSKQDTFLTLLKEEIEKEAKNKGITLDFVDTGEQVIDQVRACKKAKDENYKAIICIAYDTDTARQLEIAAGDVPIVFINKRIDEKFLKEDKYIYVGSRDSEAGKMQAEYVYEKLGKPSEINAVILKGGSGIVTEYRTLGIKQYFQEKNVKVNYIFEDSANWKTDIASNYVQIAINTKQKIDCVFANNDLMALGAVEALEKNGYDLSKTPVTGIDATVEACQSIVDGKMQFTVLQSAENIAKDVIQAAVIIGNGKSIKDLEHNSNQIYLFVPFEKVDKEGAKSRIK
ncbi:MAG: substrate-binding domain-containing protein [Lachnobacterium sp.]|nr:substrate-binding domain-containing protein [Lachnobacterium sp.]